jgi:lipid II:glycine glycyltransferase (peptidoglycan interpeptide bridge formation enzyme)
MDTKAAYRLLCLEERSLPIFFQAWWLDATCGVQGWNAALAMKGSEIHAALPYQCRRRNGFRVLTQPALTPFLGPWLREAASRGGRDGRQKELMAALMASLPTHDHYTQSWGPDVTNWLPFYWAGYQQTTRYTYVMNDLSDEKSLWKGMRDNIRSDIKKASNRFGLQVDADASPDEFLRLNDLTFARQGKRRSYSNEYVSRIDQACEARECRRIFVARDGEGRAHAGVYIVWDADSAYYLMGGSDPALRNSGAMSLCMWEAIRFASRVTRRFDFEGSMIEPIERYFRAFGSEQVSHLQVSKTPSRSLAVLLKLKSFLGEK